MNSIQQKTENQISTELRTQILEYMLEAKADNTKKAYTSDWNDFTAWCSSNGLNSLPASPDTIICYVKHLADERKFKASTIKRRISSISQAHQAKELEPPTQTYRVRMFFKGLKRKKSKTNKNFNIEQGKAPVMLYQLKAMVDALPNNFIGVRDKAILLIGWAGARRRSEIVALDVDDLDFSENGVTLIIRRSKTNQEGEAEKVSIWYGANEDTCPVRALKGWLEEAGITEGAIFRGINRHGQISKKRLSDKSVALIVKRSAQAIGLDASDFAGHSLRAGLATQSAMSGLSERSIMKQTGHKSVEVLRRYIREGSAFNDNVTSKLGL